MRLIVDIPKGYKPEDGTAFDAVMDALQHFELPASVIQVKMATKKEREAAENRFIMSGGTYSLGDEMEIDDNAAVSRSEDGCFVQAWVWVPKEDE